MVTNLRRTLVAFSVSAGLIGLAASAPAAEMEWSMATPWGGGPWLERDAQDFADRVSVLTDGRIKITVYPGGTLGSPLKVTETVRTGVAQVGHNWMAYDWGIDKTTVLFAGYSGAPTPEGYMLWLYQGGGLELWEKYRMEKFGVVSFPCGTIGTEIFLHSHKKVQNLADFQGLKIRTSGAWAEIASRLGASTVILPGAEVYGALERKVVDATEWGSPEINKPTGFAKIAKYVILPGVHQPGGLLECEVNEDVWNSLSDHDKELLRLAGKLTVFESWGASAGADLDAFRELQQGGNEIVQLSPEFIAKVREETKTWAAEQAKEDDWFKTVLDSLDSFEQKLTVWNEYRLPIGEAGGN